MEFNEVKDLVTGFTKGSIHTITYSKQLKTRKGVADVITKRSETQGRFGVDYDNIKTVYQARNTGELPTENAGLSGMEWVEDGFPYFLKSQKTGKIQLRVSRVNSGNNKTTYYKNGVECQKADVEALCLKSEFPDYKKDDKVPHPIFNIGIEKIESIK